MEFRSLIHKLLVKYAYFGLMAKHAPLVSIVDDDEGVRTATRGLVETFGYDVETFESGDAFLASESLEKTRCLIVDVQMPGMSGPELQEHLVNSGKRIPVIFITAFPLGCTRDQVLRRGAVAYLAKPFDRATLLKRLQRAIGEDGDNRST
jgi:FixJ family two-component response regulator